MLTSFPARADRVLVESLRRLDRLSEAPALDAWRLFERAELHGIAGVLHDAWNASSLDMPPALRERLAAQAHARELDHAAHLALLSRIGASLASVGVRGVALKGALLSERLYDRPSARGTSDVDLLVDERALDAAEQALGALGYRAEDSAKYQWSRREHHHVVLTSPHAPPLELHFHAYVGFGERLASEGLVARAIPAGARFEGIFVLAPPDELVYLAVHAAGHRFGRVAWLHDLRLLLDTMTDDEIALAGARGWQLGFGPVLALTASLLVDLLDVPAARLAPLGRLPRLRAPLVRAVLGEPPGRVGRSLTRFAYTTLLAQSFDRAARYARRAVGDHARRALGRA